MSGQDFTIQGPAKDHEEAQKYIDEITVPGISNERVQNLYSGWAASYEQDMGGLAYNPPVHGARELAEVLGDRKDGRILDCAAGTGLVGMEVGRNLVKGNWGKKEGGKTRKFQK